jgi:hypothetical protein
MMYGFQVSVHARAAEAKAGEAIELAGRTVRPLGVSPETLGTATMGCSFEEARDRLEQLARMYCEPDGSFVWASPQGKAAWQVDGNLYDRNERLLFVDLKGMCPPQEFDRLLKALGWPETRLMFQLTREAVFLDEEEFRRFAAVG